MISRYSYDAWGVPTVAQDTSACSIATINPFRYRSYYFDKEIEMYYLQSRYYDPVLGKYINCDAPEILGLCVLTGGVSALNIFLYCANNPVNDKDLVGCLSEQQAAAMLSITAVFAMFSAVLLTNFEQGLLAVTGYATQAISIPVLEALWWRPVLAAAIIVAAVAIVVAGVVIAYKAYLKSTQKLKNVQAKAPKSRVFKLAYASGTALIKVGKSLSFVEALTVLGVKKAACSLARRYSVTAKRPKECKSGDWGMYSTSQMYACGLATVLGCTSAPEVHGSGYYGHYHDKDHIIHIWYGYPINYR